MLAFGQDPAGINLIDSNPESLEGVGEILGEGHQAALGNGIGHDIRETHIGYDRPDVDNAAARTLLHVGGGFLAKDERRAKVGGEDRIPDRHRSRLQAPSRVNSRIIDQDVDLAEAPHGLPNKIPAVGFLLQVPDDEERLIPSTFDCFDQFFTLGLVALQAMHDHSSPRFSKPPRDSGPDSLSRAGDYGHLSR